MSEEGVGSCPQVFVVDSQANYITMPNVKKPRWARVGQGLLLLLLGLALLGLIVEGYLIYNLYQKTENLSYPKTSGQQGGTIMSQVGPKVPNGISTVWSQTQQRPFAHLIGPKAAEGGSNVVQWEKKGEAVTQKMGYDKGRLIVEEEGYYYLYSKVQLNAAEECVLIQHKVMKNTSAYERPIELLKSKSFRCWTPKPSSAKVSGMEDMWNSFLAGIFHLQTGDKIFVTVENIQKIRPGLTENFMGAFMIFP